MVKPAATSLTSCTSNLYVDPGITERGGTYNVKGGVIPVIKCKAEEFHFRTNLMLCVLCGIGVRAPRPIHPDRCGTTSVHFILSFFRMN